MCRAKSEIEHGRKLAESGAEDIWGWGSPAGRKRAQRRASMIIDAASLKRGKHALEIGCGTGSFTEKFAASGADIVAVEISPDLHDIASKRDYPKKNVRFVLGPFEKCVEEGPFDAVIGSSVLHHLDLGEALSHMFDVLSPGGIICFTEPNMVNPQIMLQKNIPWLKRKMGDSPDETAFVRWKLAYMLRKNGFCDIKIVPFDWLHPLTPSCMVSFVDWFGRLLEKIPLIREIAGSVFICAHKPSENKKLS